MSTISQGSKKNIYDVAPFEKELFPQPGKNYSSFWKDGLNVYFFFFI
jgi:hypothetical protein